MSLNIKNEAVHDLVRRLAEMTGQSQTSAVEDAVRRRLEELQGAEERHWAERARAIDEAIAAAHRLPTTGRTTEEIMDELYDESGMPR